MIGWNGFKMEVWGKLKLTKDIFTAIERSFVWIHNPAVGAEKFREKKKLLISIIVLNGGGSQPDKNHTSERSYEQL